MLSATPLYPTDDRRVGPFTLLGRLAEGGMGTVYLGRYDGRAESLVAVKILRSELAADPLYRARFVTECAASRRVSSDLASSSYIARLIDHDPDAEVPWLASEFIPGPTLHHEAARRRGLPPRDLESVAAGLAEVLHALHGHGFTHGDVKPLNIVLGPDGVRLVDLGLARRIADAPSGPGFGSPGWSPPGHRDGDPASDVHGWAMSVAYAATGTAPFGTGTPEEITARMATLPPQVAALPLELRPLVVAALAPDPHDRPTAAEVAAALRGPSADATRVLAAASAAAAAIGSTGALGPPTLIDPGTRIDSVGPAPTAPAAPARPRSPGVRARRAGALVSAAVLAMVLLAALAGADRWDVASGAPSVVGTPSVAPTPSTSARVAAAAGGSTPAVRATTAAAATKAAAAPGKAKGKNKGKGHGKGHARR